MDNGEDEKILAQFKKAVTDAERVQTYMNERSIEFRMKLDDLQKLEMEKITARIDQMAHDLAELKVRETDLAGRARGISLAAGLVLTIISLCIAVLTFLYRRS
jgi:hypothetical protein